MQRVGVDNNKNAADGVALGMRAASGGVSAPVQKIK
jgi:hypothetical protein